MDTPLKSTATIYETAEALGLLIAMAEVQAHLESVSTLLCAEPESSTWTLLKARSADAQAALP